MRKPMAIAFVVSLSTLVAAPLAESAEIHVLPGHSIQAAVNAAVEGDVVTVHPGTYDQQVVIDKSLTLRGFGDGTIIRPSQAVANAFRLFTRWGGGKTAAIVVVDTGGARATVQDLKVDGELITQSVKAATSLVGVLARDSSVAFRGLTVEDVRVQNASGILLTSVSSASPAVTGEVERCAVSGYLTSLAVRAGSRASRRTVFR